MTVDQPASTPAAPRLILASASPRRQSLLREAGYSFLVHAADLDEESYAANMMPIDLARRLAQAKAEAVASRFPNDVVLAADTVVAFGDLVLGKAASAEHARQMLALLSGTTHIVITGVSVIHLRERIEKTARVLSAVRMKSLTPKQIDDYVATNDWQGKAGAYGIQDADPFVVRLAGCHTNIVGLPMTATTRLLQSVGIVPSVPSQDTPARDHTNST